MTFSNKQLVCGAILLLLFALSACSDEADLFQQVQEARSQALAINATSNSIEAIAAYQSATDLMSNFLSQYPDGEYASEVGQMREQMLRDLRTLQQELSEFQKVQKSELNLAQPRLPSECETMVKLWQRYLDLFPSSKFAAQARDRQSRWSDRCQEEIKRGFQVFIDEAYVRLIKGPSHQLAGRPWDPEIFGQNAAPDPYALLVMNDEVVGYTPVARDAFHPVWKLGSDVLRVSDTQQLTIVIRDRDIAEKAVIALLGTSLFTFSGIQSARAALKEDHDDNIGKWIGTINELMKQGQNGSLQAGDFKQLKVRVIRPQ